MSIRPDIHSQTKKIIYNMYTFFKTLAKCKDKPELADYFLQSQERTAEACAVSLRTVQRICKESKITGNQDESLGVGSSSDLKFQSPRKRYSREKSVTELDDFDNEVIRRVVHSFYDKGEFPTSAKILVELREKLNYRGSKSSVKIILKQLNFKYKKCNDGRKFLMERSDIVTARVKFLRKMNEFRRNGDTRPVVYLDETWVNQNHTRGRIWQNEENTEGLKVPTGKGSRLIICHAGSPSFGFIKESKLIFRCNSGNKDYHSQMNATIFESWFSQMLLNLEEPSIIVSVGLARKGPVRDLEKRAPNMTDMVVMLLETPFRRWHSDNKNDLLKVGKPLPFLSALAPDKKLSKVFCRSFNPNLYQQHTWLCGSHYIQKLFCWPCLLLGKMKSVWNTVGYYDLKNLSRGIQIHQTSKEHIHNHLGLKNLEKNYFSILDVVNEHGNLFKKNYNENVRLNRLFMEHLIDLVLFLGKQELAFRGHDENSDSLNEGNFRELFDMHIIRCSQEIQNHYNSIKNIFSGMSKSIQNDLISRISEFLINQIKNEIKQCKFYSIQIDDTTDISQKTQCSIIIRYVTDKSELVERFLGFHNVSEDRTAQGLFNLVNSVLHEFDIENKLVGQCYDGACVMSGHLTGLQARVKEVAPNALFTHCLAHRLNLVLQHGCSINAKCRIFFANLTGIAAYFHNSTSRTNFVDTIVGKRIPQFVQTRWSSRSKILHTIVNEWSGFINVFDCISKDPKSSSESICGAIGHFKNLKTYEFAFLALVFNDIFIYTDNLFNILQNKSFDVEFCLRKINITYDLINKKRNEPEFLKLFNQTVTLTKPPKATRNESNNQSNFKILFYEIIDNILMQLNTRFQDTNKLLFLQLADVTKFKEYSCTFPVNALNNLKSTYPNIFYNINTLKVELEVLYSDVKYQNLLHIYDMVKIIEQDALKDILPEAYKLFILILTIN
ncbi:hypothetical protein QTP88_013509 [Uroleucon formosanum]